MRKYSSDIVAGTKQNDMTTNKDVSANVYNNGEKNLECGQTIVVSDMNNV